MPYFTLQMNPGGPVVNALIGPSHARFNALKAAGSPIPPGIPVRALIDTGASGSCVDPMVLTALGLSPTGIVAVCTPTTGTTPQNKDQYDIGLIIPGSTPSHAPLMVGNLPVLGTELFHAQGIHALIGRDVLSMCLMTYDGQSGFFSIAY